MINQGFKIEASRILIVDDHASNVSLMLAILASQGFHSVQTLTDSRRAMGIFREFVPDLVFMDWHMPNCAGPELLASIREVREADYIPVVVVTADSTPQVRQTALRMGATGFLTKPVDVSEMMNRTRTLLRMRQTHVRLYRPATPVAYNSDNLLPSWSDPGAGSRLVSL